MWPKCSCYYERCGEETSKVELVSYSKGESFFSLTTTIIIVLSSVVVLASLATLASMIFCAWKYRLMRFKPRKKKSAGITRPNGENHDQAEVSQPASNDVRSTDLSSPTSKNLSNDLSSNLYETLEKTAVASTHADSTNIYLDDISGKTKISLSNTHSVAIVRKQDDRCEPVIGEELYENLRKPVCDQHFPTTPKNQLELHKIPGNYERVDSSQNLEKVSHAEGVSSNNGFFQKSRRAVTLDIATTHTATNVHKNRGSSVVSMVDNKTAGRVQESLYADMKVGVVSKAHSLSLIPTNTGSIAHNPSLTKEHKSFIVHSHSEHAETNSFLSEIDSSKQSQSLADIPEHKQRDALSNNDIYQNIKTSNPPINLYVPIPGSASTSKTGQAEDLRGEVNRSDSEQRSADDHVIYEVMSSPKHMNSGSQARGFLP